MARIRWSKVGHFSAFARAESHLVQRTVHGAIVTICGVLLAILLFVAEVSHYASTKNVQTMGVDLTRGRDLEIHFDFTFPAFPCSVLSIDVVDVSGEHESDESLAHNGELHKVRLSSSGTQIGINEYRPPKNPYSSFVFRSQQPVVAAMNLAMERHEGCHVFGWVHTRRVAGNLHISVHAENFFALASTQQEMAEQIRHIMLDEPSELAKPLELVHDMSPINTSHTINQLSFGAEYPGKINPLDGTERTVHGNSGTYKYFLKIVPTTYIYRDGSKLETNQYSVTEYYHATPKLVTHLSLPSVHFNYDLSPIAVTVTTQRRSFLHLLVRICAVVGGVFAVTGMMDKWIHRIVTGLTDSKELR